MGTIRHLILLLLITSCAAKKTSETYVSEKDSISYVLPSENRITLKNLCDTLNFRPGPILSHTSGPIKVDVRTTKRGVVEILTKYDTIFKERTKEVIKTVTKETVKFKTPFWHWWAHLVALIIIGGGVYFWIRRN